MSKDSFGTLSEVTSEGVRYRFHRLATLQERGVGQVDRLPFSLRILLENLLRHEDGRTVTKEDIEALARWEPNSGREKEIAFMPSRVLLQDFTGVPVVVDLAAMRDAVQAMGGDPSRINPLQPVDLVIDHSVQVDYYGSPDAFRRNVELEFERNRERYTFLRWGQNSFRNFRVVPPGTGIVHQVNLEYLATVVASEERDGVRWTFPDTLVGTDSHTTMINGLGVLGWGVGGIEAEAAMLGQPISMLIPEVVGFKITGRLREGATGTDVVLRVTEMLRKVGVVGKFVEFYGDGLANLPLAARATIANMAPEYGATVGFFPIDDETLAYLRFTGREEWQVRLVEAYAKAQGLFRTADGPEPAYSAYVELDLGEVEPAIAGPRRPQDRTPLSEAKRRWRASLVELLGHRPDELNPVRLARWLDKGGQSAGDGDDPHEQEPLGRLFDRVTVTMDGQQFELEHGSVVIAAITSCTNTSNPEVMLGAGLLARKAVERGLRTKPWVKTSTAPGSQVVSDYLQESGLQRYLDELGFGVVAYGCTTCIGNSGPLRPEISRAIHEGNLVAAAVLSGNRNFEGRVNPDVRANFLASPPLVVAYALAGRMDIDLLQEPLGIGNNGQPVYLRDIWPTQEEIQRVIRTHVRSEMFRRKYADVFTGPQVWQELDTPSGELFAWDERSTYIRRPPYFDDLPLEPPPLRAIKGARALAVLGDSVTTDHISPAGSIASHSPAGRYLLDHGVAREDFNSYGARRGNHEVMMRGTFANIRLRNLLAPGTEGGITRHLPDGEQMTIYDAAMRYRDENVPLMVIAGKEYGAGSSRDWAAKGPALLGVRAVIAESYERIHRSNLVGMGILPLQFLPGESRETLGLTGEEVFDIEGVEGLEPGKRLLVRAIGPSGSAKTFEVVARIDTPVELEYYRHGGILQYVLRQILRQTG